jgi:hypothetical protein
MYLIYLLTPWSRVLLEKLTGLRLVKKFSEFYGTRGFITSFTIARHLSLSWASLIQSTPPHPTSWRHPNILPSTPGSPQWSLSLRFSHQNPIHASLLSHPRYMPRPHSSWFYHPHNIGWGVQNMKLLIMKFSSLLTVCTTCFKITKSTFYPLIVCVCCNFYNKRPLFSCTALTGSL